MSLFDQLVTQALKNNAEVASLRMVVEKELLHHDILREMSHAGLLDRLTFIGGTCLRACYGSNRLSEDLDFAGGKDFTRDQLDGLGAVLKERLFVKYGLKIEVGEPTRESGNVDTWKLKVITRPHQKHIPAQRINIDICSVPSHDSRQGVLRNYYGVDMGTNGLIIRIESREEILADKFVALAFRPNRIKNRDLWDIAWLKQNGVKLPYEILCRKVADHKRTVEEFLMLLSERRSLLTTNADLHKTFIHEIRRFLPAYIVAKTVADTRFWAYLADVVSSECHGIDQYFSKKEERVEFIM